MSQITYRQLGPNNDPVWTSYLTDLDAVGQMIMTRLNLFEGEWWLDLNDGLPLWQQILAVSGANARQDQISLLIQQRIRETPFVTEITEAKINYDGNSRSLTFYAVVKTQFGSLTIESAQPSPTVTPAPPPPGNNFLLENGTDSLALEDGSSLLLLET